MASGGRYIGNRYEAGLAARRSVLVASERGPAAPLAAVDRHHCGHQLAGDQSVPTGEGVDDVEARGDALGAVDDDRGHWNVASELNHLVAVRIMVTVKSPDAAQHGRAACGS